MELRMADEAITAELDAIRDLWIADGLTMRLFKNNHTPTNADGYTDYTECNFDGYAAVPFTDWGTVTLDGAHFAYMTAGMISFTQTGIVVTNPVYGYFVTRDSDGALVWAQRDDSAPFQMDAVGKVYNVVPRRDHRSKSA